MADSQEQRTEQPTTRRLRRMRLGGHVARSAHLVGAVVLFGISASLTWFGRSLTMRLLATVEQQLHAPANPYIQPQQLLQQTHVLLRNGLLVLIPLLAVVVLLAVAANLLQFGLVASPDAIKPQWSRLSPARAWARICSAPGFVGVALTLVKTVTVAAVAGLLLWRELPRLSALSRLAPRQLADYTGNCLGSFALKLAGVLCALALLDYALQRWRHLRLLRMTRDEQREEERDLEGIPLLRQRRRALRCSFGRRGDTVQ
jgi:flagellar biosynthetic protein FlhB